jgi:hypothetical protein
MRALATSLGAVATAHEGSLGIDRRLARHVSAPLPASQREQLPRRMTPKARARRAEPQDTGSKDSRSHGADSAGAREIVIHGDALASRLAFKLQQVEEQFARMAPEARARRAEPQGTRSKDSRCGLSPGIKGSRGPVTGPFVSSSSMFYANVVSRQVKLVRMHRMQCGQTL